MAVTLLVYERRPEPFDVDGPLASGAEPAPLGLVGALTLDAPRIRIGRGESCDLRLPDPSVSAVHATLRLRGHEYVLVDEGSLNGTRIGKETLSAHAPRRVGARELIRFGRVWVELRIGTAAITRGAPTAAKEIALDYVIAALEREGEDARPCVRVERGPDAGRDARLVGSLPVLVGRAKEAELALQDPDVSRRHLEIRRRGDALIVRDLGSKGGATLAGEPLPESDVVWRAGAALELGGTTLAFRFDAVDALAEIERGGDAKVPPAELAWVAPEAPAAPEEPPAEAAPEQDAPEPEARDDAPDTRLTPHDRRRSVRWSVTDFAVVMLALGVCSLSAVGYFVLLR